MRMNEIIREKRKELDMTQEQMAAYLGVTAPAVHKWEKGTSLPDVAILPALARVLKIDLNTLFAYEKELTDQEINMFCNDVMMKMQEQDYDAGFELAMGKVREFPNCERLIYNLAAMLDGSLTLFCVEESQTYSEEIEKLYERAAKADDEKVCNFAKQMLIIKALGKQEFDKAEKLWETLPEVTIDKKRLRIIICINRGNHDEAIKLLEEKLYVSASDLQNCLVDLMLSLGRTEREEEMEFCAERLKILVENFGLWKYGKHMADYHIGIIQKDREKTLKALRLMLSTMNETYYLHDFPLYREIQTGENGMSKMSLMSKALIENLKKENGVDGNGFLKDDEELLGILEMFAS